jgi:hypothetical protein
MTAPLTGFTSSLPTDVVLDSGVLYVNTTVLGATKGGLTFDPGVTYRNVEFDGKRSAVKLLDRKMMTAPKLSGTVIELPTGNIARIEPGAVVATTGAWTASTSYQPKRAAGLLVTGDYVAEVRAIWLRGSGGFVQVRFPSALITKYDIQSQDAEEVSIAIEIEARLDVALSGFTNVGDVPFRIEYLASV